MMKFARWVRSICLAGVMMGSGLGGGVPVQAGLCYESSSIMRCQCIGCTYWVICSVRVGWPLYVEIGTCTANNPGFVTQWYEVSASGYYDVAFHTAGPCGMATVTGRCCGGARTAITDYAEYDICDLRNSGCSAGTLTR